MDSSNWLNIRLINLHTSSTHATNIMVTFCSKTCGLGLSFACAIMPISGVVGTFFAVRCARESGRSHQLLVKSAPASKASLSVILPTHYSVKLTIVWLEYAISG